MTAWVAYVRKLLVSLAGGLTAVVATQLVHGTALTVLVLVVAFLTGAGVFTVKNGPKP